MVLPIFATDFFIMDRSIAPSEVCGVPTVTKIKSQFLINEKSLLILSFFFNPSLSVFSNLGSKKGDSPLTICLHFFLSISIPIVV